ncbi:sugar phosphate isomerase/epimerase [Chitinophaga sp. Cy-1792]|uniref:sugar phosphate isomerase/epimerase family protein n=1 Tax=Chitinophaga sp. Cy-1792 TaxID=2608339 RepID=UPI001423391D|nr:sugar phosphate isomerase/epimerase [Chitinophaga sp. Cy-1792]NIG57548.1 sugar phosphate isomerase/epimerase [Chitinophaga sp. Cy-1792]
MNNERRNFLKQSSLLGGALLLPKLSSGQTPEEGLQPFRSSGIKAGYQLTIMGTNWGFNGNTDEFCAAAKAAGYDGIEMWWSHDNKVQQELYAALKKHQLEIGYLCAGSSSDYTKHAAEFEQSLKAATGNNPVKPLYINCHSGKDYFTFEQNAALIDMTYRYSKQSGIPVYHETHRSRMLFAAHIAKQFIAAKPDLRLTLDISHWCNVHETLLHDQPEAVAAALSRASHIHARVGHPEGPQVNDPRAPEWDSAVKQHFSWWDEIVKRHQADGKRLTILTEFGPPDYQQTLPYTRQPVSDQWGINVYMMQQLRQRYGK